MAGQIDRRDFLRSLGVGVGATLGAAAAAIPLIGMAQAQEKPKGNIPSTPYRIGHMTFFTGPAAVLGEPMYKGQVLAAEEINATGGTGRAAEHQKGQSHATPPRRARGTEAK